MTLTYKFMFYSFIVFILTPNYEKSDVNKGIKHVVLDIRIFRYK